MNNFNPFEILKDKNIPGVSNWLEHFHQNPWLEKYINDILGPDFWRQVMGNQASRIRTNIFETSDEVIVRAEIPGLERESDLRVMLKGSTLSFDATVPATNGGFGNDKVILHSKAGKQHAQKIAHSVNLPCPVRDFGAKATYKNGILEVKLPKEYVSYDSHKINVQFL